MARYLFIFLLSMVLPSIAVTPQQLINGGQLLYDAMVTGDYIKQNTTLKDQDKLELLKQARTVAKQKKDAETTQYLTEQIIDQQNNSVSAQLKKALLITVVAGIAWCGGWWWRLNICANSSISYGHVSCHDLRHYHFNERI